VKPVYKVVVVVLAMATIFAAVALNAHAMANASEVVTAATLGLAVVGGSIFLAFRSTEASQRSRDEIVGRIDEALQALARRTSGEYVSTSSYHHPAIGTIRYAGRATGIAFGRRWVVYLSEGDDANDHTIEIAILDLLPGSKRPGLKKSAASPGAQATLHTLLADKHQVELAEDDASGSIRPFPATRLTVRLSGLATRSADPASLESLLQTALNLAVQLTP
jgi:hypothetical protein